MWVKVYIWKDGSVKVSTDEKGRDLVPFQIAMPEVLKSARVVEIEIPDYKMAAGQ